MGYVIGSSILCVVLHGKFGPALCMSIVKSGLQELIASFANLPSII
jgi:hypothetical protein